MTTKFKGDSVRVKLSSLAHKLGVPHRNLETVFLIERLVARLVADQRLSQHLVFKGGFVGLRVYGSPRYTIDLGCAISWRDVVAEYKATEPDDPKLMPRFDDYYRKLKGTEK